MVLELEAETNKCVVTEKTVAAELWTESGGALSPTTPTNVVSGPQFYSTITGNYALRVNGKGGYYVDPSGNENLYIRNAADSNPIISLNGSDGSATFAGNVNCQKIGDTHYSTLNADGALDLYRNTNAFAGVIRIWSDVGSTKDLKIGMYSDGSATFAGPVSRLVKMEYKCTGSKQGAYHL